MLRRVRFVVLGVVLAVVGFGAGATAQGGPWSRPGDPVATLEDADRAIVWWNGQPSAASREPAGLAEANDRIWLAIGQIVDDLMGLDLRTRALRPAPTPTIRSAVYLPEVGEGFAVAASMCAPGELVTGGGFDVPALGEDGLPAGTTAVTPATSYPIVVDGVHGWAGRISRVPPEPATWADVVIYAICSG